MTDAADFQADDTALPLPGLEIAPTHGAGEVEAAARRTLAALSEAGHLDERHAVVMQALLTGARQLDRAAASGKAKDYGVANLLVQLRETFLVLMPEDGGEPDDEWTKLVERLRGAAPVRYTPQP
jgi:hypothetical protein